MKIKLSGAGFQTKGLISPGVLLTLSILRLNSNPDPFSGVKSSEKADIRRNPGRRARSVQNVCGNVPVVGGESSCRHKRG